MWAQNDSFLTEPRHQGITHKAWSHRRHRDQRGVGVRVRLRQEYLFVVIAGKVRCSVLGFADVNSSNGLLNVGTDSSCLASKVTRTVGCWSRCHDLA